MIRAKEEVFIVEYGEVGVDGEVSITLSTDDFKNFLTTLNILMPKRLHIVPLTACKTYMLRADDYQLRHNFPYFTNIMTADWDPHSILVVRRQLWHSSFQQNNMRSRS